MVREILNDIYDVMRGQLPLNLFIRAGVRLPTKINSVVFLLVVVGFILILIGLYYFVLTGKITA